MEHEQSVDIEASPQAVWSVLVDVGAWPSWTESMATVERLDQGRFALGSRVRIKQPGFPAATWEVTAFEPGRSFTWESRSPAFTSVGEHRVVARGRTGCTVQLRFRTSGPLAGLFSLLAGRLSRKYVAMEAAGLKQRCEAAPR